MNHNKTFNCILKSCIPNEKRISLIKGYSQIEELNKMKEIQKISYYYYNREKIHKILYDEQKIISIPSNISENNLETLFYITLLIKEEPDITNYIYYYNYIENVNNLRRNSKKPLTIFILSLIVIELINNYKNSDFFDNNRSEKKLRLTNEENKTIKKNNNKLNEYEVNLKKRDIENNNIEEIYTDVIISLIKGEKIKNYEFSSDVLDQLNMNSIELTENMYQKFFALFNDNDNYIRKYMIEKKEDLYNEEKINFYYILLKYIFKHQIYIYKILFLLKTRKTVLKIMKSDWEKISNNIGKNIKSKVHYVIKKLCDCDYYIIKYFNSKYIEILKYYKNYFFETKKTEIEILEKYIKNADVEEPEQYLNDYEPAIKANERAPIVMFMLEETHQNKNEIGINEILKEWQDLERKIKGKKIDKNDKQILKKYFNSNKDNKNILLKIFNEDEYEYFMKQLEDYQSSIIVEENYQNQEYGKGKLLSGEVSKIVVEEIDLKSTDSNEKIIKAIPSETSITENRNNKKNESEEGVIINEFIDSINQKNIKMYDNSEYNLMNNEDTIGKHDNYATRIFETNNGYYISEGGDNIIKIYNEECHKVLELENKSIRGHISELKISERTQFSHKNIKLLTNCKRGLSTIKINLERLDYKIDIFKEANLNLNTCLEIRNNTHIILGRNGVYQCHDLLSKIIYPKIYKIINNNYMGGILINKNIIAITSNRIKFNGENKLQFYNTNTQHIFKIIEGYSFIPSTNGLVLMPMEESSEKNKILLCACKKYGCNQKNGILLVNAEFTKNEDIKKPFYDTGDFEVHCICPLGRKNEKYLERLLDPESHKLIETDYFLVGGFDPRKNRGLIKLYKLKRSKKIKNTKIEFIQDISVGDNDKNNGFKMPINSMIQIQYKGKILASCLDGKIYLFSAPKIDILQKYDKSTGYDGMKLIKKKEILRINIGID